MSTFRLHRAIGPDFILLIVEHEWLKINKKPFNKRKKTLRVCDNVRCKQWRQTERVCDLGAQPPESIVALHRRRIGVAEKCWAVYDGYNDGRDQLDDVLIAFVHGLGVWMDVFVNPLWL